MYGLWQKPATYWHMLPKANQARKAIWDAVNSNTGKRRIDEAFPQGLRASTRENDMLIRFRNGSTWQVIGSDNYDEAMVGSPPYGVVFSEYALSNPDAWALAVSPILLANGGWAIFNTTPRGRNHAEKLLRAVRHDPEWFTEVLTVDDTGILAKDVIAGELRRLTLERGEREANAIIQQEYYCLPPTSDIWTDKGQKPIKDIQVNDTVLTHSGRWRKVTRLFCHENEKPLAAIHSAGSYEPLTCTVNHPVRLCNPATQTYKWVTAGTVKVGDYVVLPRLKLQQQVIDAVLAELIAWFIAEGSVAKTLIQFSLNKTEQNYAARICAAGTTFGKSTITDVESGLAVIVNSTWLADFLTTHCGYGAANKRIPWHLIVGHEQLVYDTLIDGDGCRGDYSGVSEVYTTISKSLALDVQLLAHMIGKRASVVMRPAEKQSQVILGRLCTVADSYAVRVSIIRKTTTGRPEILPQKHGVAAKVRSVELLPACPLVYNFSVQYDESYIAQGRTVHNCSFDAAIPGAIYGPELRKAEEEGRVTDVPYDPRYPVTTAWDLGRADATAIVFGQQVGEWIHIIDATSATSQGPAYFAKQVNNFRDYAYRVHLFPHDGNQKAWSLDGGTAITSAKAQGIHPIRMLPKGRIDDRIRAARALFPKIKFDRKATGDLRDALINYQYEYDERLDKFRDQPLHDWTSHYSDAFSYLAIGIKGVHSERRPEATVADMEYDYFAT